jgi:hypothetical protein
LSIDRLHAKMRRVWCGGKAKRVIQPPCGNNGHYFAGAPDLFIAHF